MGGRFSGSLHTSTFLDGTILKNHYKGTLLATITYDGDNSPFLLAFSVCDIEDERTWD